MITETQDWGSENQIINVDQDPTVTPVDAQAGDRILYNGIEYTKQDSGPSINVIRSDQNSYSTAVTLSLPTEDNLRIDIDRNNGLSTLTSQVNIDELADAVYSKTQTNMTVAQTFEALYLKVFPFYYDQVQSLAVTSETYPVTPQMEITTPVDMPAGKYQIVLSLVKSNPDTNDSSYAQLGGDLPFPIEFVIESKDATDTKPYTSITYLDLPAGSFNLTLSFRKEDAGALDYTVDRALISIKRCCP